MQKLWIGKNDSLYCVFRFHNRIFLITSLVRTRTGNKWSGSTNGKPLRGSRLRLTASDTFEEKKPQILILISRKYWSKSEPKLEKYLNWYWYIISLFGQWILKISMMATSCREIWYPMPITRVRPKYVPKLRDHGSTAHKPISGIYLTP